MAILLPDGKALIRAGVAHAYNPRQRQADVYEFEVRGYKERL